MDFAIIQKFFSSNWNIVFDDLSMRWSQSYFNDSTEFNDPKAFDNPQVFEDPKGISNGSMDFDNPKAYGDTFIFDGLVYIKKSWIDITSN